MMRCFSVCWCSHLGHLYWTSSYSKPYFSAMWGMKFYNIPDILPNHSCSSLTTRTRTTKQRTTVLYSELKCITASHYHNQMCKRVELGLESNSNGLGWTKKSTGWARPGRRDPRLQLAIRVFKYSSLLNRRILVQTDIWSRPILIYVLYPHTIW